MILRKEFVSLTTVVTEIRKKQRKGCYEQKMFQQKVESCKFKLPLKKLGWLGQCKVKKKMSQPQKQMFWEKGCQK